jgi:cytochrome c-type biogenesis protein CcmE
MKNRHKRKRLIFVGLIFAISLISLFFIIRNFRENIVFFYSPSEIQTAKINNSYIRIGGLVKEGSIKKIDALTTEFVVTDLKQEIKVEYIGLLPDLFREKQGVVAKGKFDISKNQFFSRELLIKHDENYMPPEVAKSLENKKVN